MRELASWVPAGSSESGDASDAVLGDGATVESSVGWLCISIRTDVSECAAVVVC